LLNHLQIKELYLAHGKNVHQLALSYLQNIEDAEEVTQDVFVSLYQNYTQFEEKSALKTWIYRITVNKCLDFIKAKKRKKRFAVITSIFNKDQSVKHEKADFHHPGVVMENKENAAILFKAIEQLPENQRTVFLLSQTEGLGNKEIAVIIDKSVGAVESLLQRAKENLRKQLHVYYDNYQRN
jgi:RNA polymerase sigma factor (sigma-70 family)